MNFKSLFNNFNIARTAGALALALAATGSAYASTANDLADIANNIESIVGEGITAVKALAMIIGLILLITGIMSFKQHANDMQGTSGHAKKGFVSIILGACLLMAPTVLSVLEMSLLGTSNAALS